MSNATAERDLGQYVDEADADSLERDGDPNAETEVEQQNGPKFEMRVDREEAAVDSGLSANAETGPQTIHLAAIEGETSDQKLDRLAETLDEKWRAAYDQMRSEGKTEFLLPSPGDDQDGKEAQLWLAILDTDTPTARLVLRLKLTAPSTDGEYQGTYELRGNDYGYIRETIEGEETWISLREQLEGADLTAYEVAIANGETSYRTILSETETEIHYWETDFETGISKEIVEEKKSEEEAVADDKIDATEEAGEYSSENTVATSTAEAGGATPLQTDAPEAPLPATESHPATQSASPEAETTAASESTASTSEAPPHAGPGTPSAEAPAAPAALELTPGAGGPPESAPTQAPGERFIADGAASGTDSRSTAAETTPPAAATATAPSVHAAAAPMRPAAPAAAEAHTPLNRAAEAPTPPIALEAAMPAKPPAPTLPAAKFIPETPAATELAPLVAESAPELTEPPAVTTPPPAPAATPPAGPEQPAPEAPESGQGGPQLELPHETPARSEQIIKPVVVHQAKNQTAPHQQVHEITAGEAVDIRAEIAAHTAEMAISHTTESARTNSSEAVLSATQIEQTKVHIAEAAPATTKVTAPESVTPSAEAHAAETVPVEAVETTPNIAMSRPIERTAKPAVETRVQTEATTQTVRIEAAAQTESAPIAEAIFLAKESTTQSAPTWTQTNRRTAAELTDWFTDFGAPTETAAPATLETVGSPETSFQAPAQSTQATEAGQARATTARAQPEDAVSDLGDIVIPLKAAAGRRQSSRRARQTFRTAA